jgi:hypothetical protein
MAHQMIRFLVDLFQGSAHESRPHYNGVQRLVFESMAELRAKDNLTLNDFIDILQVLSPHMDDADLMYDGFAMLNILIQHQHHKEMVVEAGAIQHVVVVMRANPFSYELQGYACCLLDKLIVDNPLRQTQAAALGVMKLALKAMKNHPERIDLQCFVCALLATLARNHLDNQGLIADGGGIEAVLSTMQSYPGEKELLTNCCNALYQFCGDNEKNQALISIGGGIDASLNAMRLHRNDTLLQNWCMAVLSSLSWNNAKFMGCIVQMGGIETIIACMERFSPNIDLLVDGCYSLCNLANQSRENVVRIGLLGGFHAVARAEKEHPTNVSVQQAVRSVIFVATLTCVQDLLNQQR